MRVPGPPYRFSATPAEVGSAPALGSVDRVRGAARRPHPTVAPGRGLEGVRVLDFTWAAAGPYATCLLALLGADVVKVESTRRPDPARRGFLADYGGINRSPNFNEINLDKRSFQVDLSQPDGPRARPPPRRLGRRRGRQLPPGRDGAGSGSAPRACSSDGPTCSWCRRRRTAPPARTRWPPGWPASSARPAGCREQTGYVDGPPTEIGESTDYRSANALAVAILAALLHRARTGRGSAHRPGLA